MDPALDSSMPMDALDDINYRSKTFDQELSNFVKETLKISQKAGKWLQHWDKRLHRPRALSQHVHVVYEQYSLQVKTGSLWFG